MGILKYAIGAGYRRFYDNLGEIAKKENRNQLALFVDAAFCTLMYGSGLADYLNYELYKRSFKERKEYVTIRTQDGFYKKVSPPQYKTTFTVKPNFMKKFSKYIGREFFLPSEGDAKGLSDFIDRNPQFIEKPVDGLGGHGVKKILAADLSSVDEYYKYLLDNRLFVEQYIVQHEKMSALCDASVNTIRVMTSSVSGTPEIIFVGLRVGNGSAVVDNFHGGGMGVLVDEETGVLIGDGIDKDLNHFAKHPKSGITFDGYALPYWDEIKNMVCEAALVEPRIMVIGWDVAITSDGPIFVEANRRPGFDMVQVCYGRGRKDIVRKALSQLKAGNKKK